MSLARHSALYAIQLQKIAQQQSRVSGNTMPPSELSVLQMAWNVSAKRLKRMSSRTEIDDSASAWGHLTPQYVATSEGLDSSSP